MPQQRCRRNGANLPRRLAPAIRRQIAAGSGGDGPRSISNRCTVLNRALAGAQLPGQFGFCFCFQGSALDRAVRRRCRDRPDAGFTIIESDAIKIKASAVTGLRNNNERRLAGFCLLLLLPPAEIGNFLRREAKSRSITVNGGLLRPEQLPEY